MPATKKFVLLSGLLGSSLVLRHDGWSPATLNSTCTRPCGPGPGWVGGTLYRATRGLSVGVMTASVPVTRDLTTSETSADAGFVPAKPSLMVTLMLYLPSCMG